MEQPNDRDRARDGDASDAAPAGRGATDIQALAERVYRLMLAEARLDRARGVATSRPRS
jgi:hypothetical protein